MTLADGVSRRSIAVGGVGDWDVGSISVRVSEISWLGISAPLAKSLGAPGHKGGSGSGVSSHSGQTVSVAVSIGVGIGVGTVSNWEATVAGVSLGISRPLAIVVSGPAAMAGGAESKAAHSGPVGVGVVEGGVGSIEVARVGLSLAGDDGDNGSSNLQ